MRAATVHRAAAIAVVALWVATLTGCSQDSGSPAPSSSGSATASTEASGASARDAATPSTGQDPSAAAVGQGAPAGSSDQPALQLAALLGQHSVLAADMMRARIRGDADLAQAANAALGQNTQAMAKVLGPYLDEAALGQFGEIWAAHILSLFDYARGHSAHDEAIREKARKASVEFEGELAEYFVSHSAGRLDRGFRPKTFRFVVSDEGHLVPGPQAQIDQSQAKEFHLLITILPGIILPNAQVFSSKSDTISI